ncbi:DUF4159 domain-containing protein [Rhizobium sp. C4]|uniref:DUF4159 domain-containing protein n=1 Tax=Rhizobium sp. C4 TaxID=1349800 RepID=UPI001E650BDF|nr:DUF4159 domain-containing protein [Rhizobium sp. C4]MCD2173745.1 DUF4159 domain-containing protein [Rhizobium sp. C4]
MGALTFANPVLLVALAALPAIWWLLRVTPPRPVREIFPPLAILTRIGRREETPAKSPWWLTALRMALAALIILALSGPVLDPHRNTLSKAGPLALVIDNDWAAAPDWADRMATAESLIEQATRNDVPVSLTLTAEPVNDAVPTSPEAALTRLKAAGPRPLEADRKTAFSSLATALENRAPGTIAFISSGVAAARDGNFVSLAAALKPGETRLYTSRNGIVALTEVRNDVDRTKVTVTRPQATGPATYVLDAMDEKGRVLMKGTAEFKDGEKVATGTIDAPIELRNDFARVAISDSRHAGGTYLLDNGFKRRRVGLLSGDARFLSQPLLSPLYYIKRALAPYADIAEPGEADLSKAITDLIAEKPSIIILADIGKLPEATYPQILDWIKLGGTLVRFAGPRLAATPAGDPLVPVELREGERSLGGALSWSEPQPLAPFPANSPFAGLPKPDGVTVSRQVLANPSPTLAEHTWASLADGTPLVTAKKLEAGHIVLFHTSADTSWSDLSLSGSFVEMLRRITQLSRAFGGTAADKTETLAPFRLLSAEGILTAEMNSAKPLTVTAGKTPLPGFENPPGLYGSEEGFLALNLFRPGVELAALNFAPQGLAVTATRLADAGTTELRPAILLTAFLLLVADSIAVFILGGAFSGLVNRRRASASAAIVLALGAGLALMPHETRAADDTRPGDQKIVAALDTTHLAYVRTGEEDVDRISQAGLMGLSDFIRYRTSLEPGDPVGIDIARDELAFYPIIYWPVTATAPMPSPEAINRIDAYMRAGGTVLFDTRDQDTNLEGSAASPNTERLQAILGSLDIPPLEPVPHAHVLTKSFYLLQNFPGRYAGSPLWIEASGDAKRDAARPVQSADGVSPILITGNDFAGAWAADRSGNPLLPTVPPDERQREMAFRAGVNIVMYMLTGNYKADQVHIPALLERLGQ